MAGCVKIPQVIEYLQKKYLKKWALEYMISDITWQIKIEIFEEAEEKKTIFAFPFNFSVLYCIKIISFETERNISTHGEKITCGMEYQKKKNTTWHNFVLAFLTIGLPPICHLPTLLGPGGRCWSGREGEGEAGPR